MTVSDFMQLLGGASPATIILAGFIGACVLFLGWCTCEFLYKLFMDGDD